jgi:hypothetical protein
MPRLSVRNTVACAMLGWHALVGAGLPLPSLDRPAPTSERFPCEHCSCGCRTAEQCWRHCCCFTQREKVLWARRNGVPIPPYVLAAAERERAAAEKPRCPHCAQRTRPPVEESRGIGLLDALRCQGLIQLWETLPPGGSRPPHVSRPTLLSPGGPLRLSPPVAYCRLPETPPTPPPIVA